MYKHLLIATDGSELADKAVSTGLELAKALGARVTAVTVTEPLPALVAAALAERGVANPLADYQARSAAEANRILTKVSEAAKGMSVECTTQHVADQEPAQGIIEAADKNACDLIVMASHGRRGIQRLLLGSQANKVVTMSSVPVLICR